MKLLIVDDHFLVRKGLVSMFIEDKSIECIKEASNIDEASNIIMKDKPDMVLVDLKLGKEDGLDLALKGKQLSKNSKFIIITSFISQESFLKAEQIGIDGYILKDAFSEDIFYAVSAVNRGKKYYDSSIVGYKEKSKENLMIEVLTDREKEVLRELGKGYSNDAIAKELYISQNTVKKHVSSIFAKLNISQRAQAVFLVNNRLSF
jgi:DNA-binding NarL/FixJ family response regulator